MMTYSEGFMLAISVIVLYVVIAKSTDIALNRTTVYTESDLRNINLLSERCKLISESYDNLSVRSICKDIHGDVVAKNIDKAVRDAVYLSILLDGIDDPTLDNLRVYVDAVVSSTASV